MCVCDECQPKVGESTVELANRVEVQKRAVRIRVSPPIIVDMVVYPYVFPSVDMYQDCLPSRSWVLSFCYPLGARYLLLVC